MKRVKTVSLIIVVVFIALTSFHPCEAYHEKGLPNNLQVKVEEESYLIINGKTNVNSFQCHYDNLPINDIINIDVSLQKNNLYVDDAIIALNITDFDCGNRMMNNDLHDLLQKDKYPAIMIEIKNIEVKETSVSQKEQISVAQVVAIITISGRENEYKLPITISRNKSKRTYSGKIKLNILDFGLEPPKKMMGLVVVDKMIEIEFKLNVSLLNV